MRANISKILVTLLVTLSMAVSAQTTTSEIRNKPEELYVYACGLYKRNFYDMALAELKRFLNTYPNDASADKVAYLKIHCHSKLKQYDEMLADITAFRTKYPKSEMSDELGIMGADYLVGQNKLQEAHPILEQLVLSKNKRIVEYATFYLAQCDLQAGKKAEAINAFISLAQLPFEPNYIYRPYAAREYADYLMRIPKYQEAAELLDKILHTPKLSDDLREDALFLYGELSLKMDKKNEALQHFESCLAQFPKGRHAKWCHIYRIRIMMDSEKYDVALRMIEDWRQKHPDEINDEMDFLQAFSLMESTRYNEALPYFQRMSSDAKTTEDRRITSAFYSIYCMKMAKHYADAAASAAEFIETYPKTSHIGNVLLMGSEAQMMQSRLDEAEKLCRKAMDFFIDKPSSLSEATKLLVEILGKSGRWVDAAKALQKQAETANVPNKDTLLLEAAECLVRAQNEKDAIALYKSVAQNTKSKDTQFSAYSNILSLQLSKQEYEPALETTAQLKLCCPTDKMEDLLYNEANILYCAGKKEDAIITLNNILKNYAKNTDKRLRTQFMLCSILMATSRFKEAIPILDELMHLPENTLKALINFNFLCLAGDAYSAENRQADARNTWQKIDTLPNTQPAEVAECHYRIAKNLLETRTDVDKAEKLLKDVEKEYEKAQDKSAFPMQKEFLSLLAEANMLCNRPDIALAYAEKSLKCFDEIPRASARALYIMAFIYFNNEKNVETANRFATQCYILTDDSIYSPSAMAISIAIFRSQGKNEQAEQVLKELSGKYPLWLAAHPEIRNK